MCVCVSACVFIYISISWNGSCDRSEPPQPMAMGDSISDERLGGRNMFLAEDWRRELSKCGDND